MEHYLTFSFIALGISWLLYYFLLKREKSLAFNRFYLLGSLILCLIAPLLQLEVAGMASEAPNIDFTRLAPDQSNDISSDLSASQIENEQITLPTIIISLYIFITVGFLIRFSNNLFRIIAKIRKGSFVEIEGLNVLPIDEKGNTFSFLHYVFLNKDDLEKGHFSTSVFQHELAHSKQYHSVDILFIEFLSCFLWFNPIIWLYKKAIITNHEYLADAAVLRAGVDLRTYSRELIQAGNKNQPFQLISGFNFNQTKKRLQMLHSNKHSGTISTIKIVVVIILFSGVFLFSSFKNSGKSDLLENPEEVKIEYLDSTKESGDTNSKDAIQNAQRKSLPFAVVEQIPLFPSCEEAGSYEAQKACTSKSVQEFVTTNMEGESAKLLVLPKGNNVVAQFRIDESGKATNVRARATSPQLNTEEKALLEKEIISVVYSLPRFKPAQHEGQVVGVLYAVRL